MRGSDPLTSRAEAHHSGACGLHRQVVLLSSRGTSATFARSLDEVRSDTLHLQDRNQSASVTSLPSAARCTGSTATH
jgi:hypothetical protein